AKVVFQATFFDPLQRVGDDQLEIGFIGFADFLHRTASGNYEVEDTKLARRAKVTALMQLAAYAEQLERLEVPVSPEVVLILGNGARSRHKLSDIASVFRARRDRLHELLLERAGSVGADGLRASAAAIAWGAEGIAACGRCEVCEPEVQRTRDPLLIAGIRARQRDKLVAAGLSTIDDVARVRPAVQADEVSVEGIAKPVLERLSMQAETQLRAQQGAPPPFRIIDATALAAIPPPNDGDLFFDFEG